MYIDLAGNLTCRDNGRPVQLCKFAGKFLIMKLQNTRIFININNLYRAVFIKWILTKK